MTNLSELRPEMAIAEELPRIPDCRGMTPEEATKAILAIDNSVQIEVDLDSLPHHASMFSVDFVPTRVRLMLGTDGKIAHVPKRG